MFLKNYSVVEKVASTITVLNPHLLMIIKGFAQGQVRMHVLQPQFRLHPILLLLKVVFDNQLSSSFYVFYLILVCILFLIAKDF